MSESHSLPPTKIGVMVAARTGSSRLPSKALLPLGGRPMIIFLMERIRAVSKNNDLVFATTNLAADDELASIVATAGFEVFRGANHDVVRRFVNAADSYKWDYVVRITGDCPFVDSETLNYCLTEARKRIPFDILSTKNHFPIGIDFEIYRCGALSNLHLNQELSEEDREHLTLFMYNHPELFEALPLRPKNEWRCDKAFTVDTPEDYLFVQNVVRDLGRNDFNIADLCKCVNNED